MPARKVTPKRGAKSPRARCHKTVAALAEQDGIRVAIERFGLTRLAVRYSCKLAREGRA